LFDLICRFVREGDIGPPEDEDFVVSSHIVLNKTFQRLIDALPVDIIAAGEPVTQNLASVGGLPVEGASDRALKRRQCVAHKDKVTKACTAEKLGRLDSWPVGVDVPRGHSCRLK